jgi:hypothetical protein
MTYWTGPHKQLKVNDDECKWLCLANATTSLSDLSTNLYLLMVDPACVEQWDDAVWSELNQDPLELFRLVTFQKGIGHSSTMQAPGSSVASLFAQPRYGDNDIILAA